MPTPVLSTEARLARHRVVAEHYSAFALAASEIGVPIEYIRLGDDGGWAYGPSTARPDQIAFMNLVKCAYPLIGYAELGDENTIEYWFETAEWQLNGDLGVVVEEMEILGTNGFLRQEFARAIGFIYSNRDLIRELGERLINDGELTGEDIRAYAQGRVRPIDPSDEWAAVMMLEPFTEQMTELDKLVLAYNQDTA